VEISQDGFAFRRHGTYRTWPRIELAHLLYDLS
jgi:hypothetical protein